MSSQFGFNVEKIYSEAIGCVLLCKCVPVLTLDVLQTAEDPNYVGKLTTFPNRDISRL